ncbi:hypothetical protein [Aggregatilinea lenta]|uniref:hypothetical protein n=1 Tax=Aggregatilinea lenta TaxID=913108 RepID=UPI000E5BAA8F|nr:hypothetical protein [Aggregatilinea lenta]
MSEVKQENPRYDMPRVVVAQRVIDKITRGALLYPEPETGEAMIGLVVSRPGQSEPEIYILDTISPGERAVREWGMFEQGDDWQGDVFHWLYINWETYRAQRRGSYGNAVAAKWDVPLAHVGDWHKQPDDMIEPSGGDLMQARRMINDAETPIAQVVAPIVTMYSLKHAKPVEVAVESAAESGASSEAASEPDGDDPAPETEVAEASTPAPERVQVTEYLMGVQPPPPAPGMVTVERPGEGWLIRIDFWYTSRRLKRFARLVPEVWPDDRLPGLPPLAWHLAHPRRFDQEYSLLAQAGYTVDVVRWDADGKPPYEICFSVYKPGNRYAILLVTSIDYPTSMPAARVAPMVTATEDEDLFEKLYDASSPLLITQMPEWPWDSKRTLLELMWHFEKTLKEDSVV